MRQCWGAVAVVLGGVLLGALGRVPAVEAGTVPAEDFDKIISQLNARPSRPPRLEAPASVAAETPEARACGLERKDLVLSVPEAAGKALPGEPIPYRLETQRLPLLVDRRSSGPVVAVVDEMTVNADGEPRAYHPGDPLARCPGGRGSANCALDTVCNAGVRLFDGAREIHCGAHSDEFQTAWTDIWDTIASGKATAIPASLWRRDPKHASATRFGFQHPDKPLTVVFREAILARAGSGRPCTRDAAGAQFPGSFVSKTSLTGNQGATEIEGGDWRKIVTDRRCSPIPYVKPEQVRSIVIPLGGFAGAHLGDVAVGYRKDAAGVERYVYALVVDYGPSHRFGEGSIGFNAALKGESADAATPGEVNQLDIRSKDGAREAVAIAIFRGTAGRVGIATPQIDRAAEAALKRWAGGNLDAARAKLKSCAAALGGNG